MKILHHPEMDLYRVVMRREQVSKELLRHSRMNKICINQALQGHERVQCLLTLDSNSKIQDNLRVRTGFGTTYLRFYYHLIYECYSFILMFEVKRVSKTVILYSLFIFFLDFRSLKFVPTTE